MTIQKLRIDPLYLALLRRAGSAIGPTLTALMLLSSTLLAGPVNASPPAPAIASAASLDAQIGTIAVCEDENEWPPYSYFQRSAARKTGKVVGYAVDVLDEILSRHHIAYRIDMIPWSRCMAVAPLGKEYQMALNLSYSPERARDFLLSRAYYSTTTYYYYSRRNNPKGLAIASPADLKKYRACGVRGYNYSEYGLEGRNIDQGAGDFTALIAKIQLGRCALFLEKNEVMQGYGAIGTVKLADPDIGMASVPGMRPSLFYLGVSRKYAQAALLHELIDDELLRMEASGRLGELWNKAVPSTAKREPLGHRP